MKAKRLVFPHKLTCQVEEYEVADVPGANEVLVENRWGLISPGTELAMFTESHVGFPIPDFRYAKYPFHPGYAAVGTALKVGENVTAIRPGDTVITRGHHASHQAIVAAEPRPLALASLPALDLRLAPFAFLAEIASTAVFAAQMQMGMNVAVFGLGLIGNLAAQLLRQAGARRVLAFDPLPQRRETARRCGLSDVLDPREGDLNQRIADLTGGQGCHIVVEATGSPQVAATVVKVVAQRGKVVLLGSPRGSANLELYWDIHRTGISIIGGHANHLDEFAYRNAPNMARLCLEFIADRRLLVEPLLTHSVPAVSAPQAYLGLMEKPAEYLGVLLDLQRWQ